MKKIAFLFLLLVATLFVFHPLSVLAEPVLLDDFESIDQWNKITATGTSLDMSHTEGYEGKAICLEYNFGQNKSYVLISKKINFKCLPNHEFIFYIKRDQPDNSFEFKLIGADGNTYIKKWYSFASVNKWKKIIIKADEITYAWGPDSGKNPDQISSLEIAVTGEGKGKICIDSISLTEQEYLRPKGYYPRWLYNEQAYWTITGVPDDNKEILICEDGTIEPHSRGFSVMPFIYTEGNLLTRDDAKITHSLAENSLPLPSVIWEYKNIILKIDLFAAGLSGESSGYSRYSIKNNGKDKLTGSLFLAIQPYQVYPPWQGGGGISIIKKISQDDKIISINDQYKIYPLTKPDKFGAQTELDTLPEGNIVDSLEKGGLPEKQSVNDAGGFASGALQYNFELKEEEEKNIFIVHPLYNTEPDINQINEQKNLIKEWNKKYQQVLALWKEKITKVEINIPETFITNVFKSNIAYNLITKDGPALQPGSRSYDKSWMRDGGIQGVALLEAGLLNEPKEFIDWFSTFQFESGEIPPIIDNKAEDPLWEEKKNNLVEYDSQGQYIWYILQYYHFTNDINFLKDKYNSVIKDLKFLKNLRAKRLTSEYKNATGEKKIYYGILPESTSHEGYHMKHSYWDDFWGLKGFEDALKIARILNKETDIAWLEQEYNDFKKCVYASLKLLIRLKKLNYIPGCAELADFDPTSTSGAITYCNQLDNLPQKQLQSGFDRYFTEVENRNKAGVVYRITPYELRSVSAFLFMEQKERALKLLRFMLNGIRPAPWNTFGEVLHSDYRYPTYIGDIPHTWVGAEYIKAVRNIFLYEKNHSLILGAGIDEKWLKEEISIKNMPSHFGNLSYSLKEKETILEVKVTGTANPQNGFVFYSPYLKKKIKSVNLNGRYSTDFSAYKVTFKELPADIVIQYK